MRQGLGKILFGIVCFLVGYIPTNIYAGTQEQIRSITTLRFGTVVLMESGKATYQGSVVGFSEQPGFKKFPDVKAEGGGVTLPGKWKCLAANTYTFYGIREDGSLWATGFNDVGQVGNGTKINQERLVQIGKDKTWKSVTGVYGGALAVAQDGSLWSWGLLKGTKVPSRVGTAKDWKEVYGGLAIKNDGSVWDELGKVKVCSGKEYKKIVRGDGHYLMLKVDGSLWGKGYNHTGQLGNLKPGEESDYTLYKQFVRLGNDKWKDIAVTAESSFGIKEDGSLWSWGNNGSFVLGLEFDHKRPRKAPYLIGEGVKFKRLPVIEHGSDAKMMFAIDENDFVYGWGNNAGGSVTPDIEEVRIPTKINYINNQVKGITIEENGQEFYYERDILEDQGYLLLPAKLLTDKYGIQVQYDVNSKKGCLIKGNTEVKFTIDSKKIQVNGKEEEMPLVARLHKGSVYIPASAVVKYLGVSINYNVKDKKIYLTEPAKVSNLVKGKIYLADDILDRAKEVPQIVSWMYNPYNWETVKRTHITLTQGAVGEKISATGPVLTKLEWVEDKNLLELDFDEEFEYWPCIIAFKDNKIVGKSIEGMQRILEQQQGYTYIFRDNDKILGEVDQIGIFQMGKPEIFIVDLVSQSTKGR